MQAAIADMAAEIRDFTVLVNNAASDDRHEWDTMTPEFFDDRIRTNLRHYVFAIQAVAPAMLAAEHGSIINIGSSTYMTSSPGMPSASPAWRASPAPWPEPSDRAASGSTRCFRVGSLPNGS